MESLGNKLFVKFKSIHDLEYKSLKLYNPNIWEMDLEEGDLKMDGKVNKLLVNPQIATVMVTSPKFRVSKGERVFLHYMAYEWGEEDIVHINGEDCNVVDGNHIIFKIKEDDIELVPDTFLGELIEEDQKTESGIIISATPIRKAATINITHVPSERVREVEEIKVGDIVNTVDDHQYVINFNDRKYVVAKSHEIVGLLC